MSNHQEVHKKYLSVSAQTRTFQSKREPRLPVEEKKIAVYYTICLPREPLSSLQQDFSRTQII